MNSATRFQFWSVAKVARTVLMFAVVMLVAVITASMRPTAIRESAPQGSERVNPPGLPDAHHHIDSVA
jgi:hypothetical protein